MGFRKNAKVKLELFYGESDLWFELGYVMNNNLYSLDYVFSFNSRR